jgi:hypothetical protein
MEIIFLLAVIYLVAKVFTTLIEFHVYRKEIFALFYLNKNIRKSLYHKETSYYHHLLNKNYKLHVFTDIEPEKINHTKYSFFKSDIFFKKEDKYLAIDNLSKISLVGFLFKRKVKKLKEDAFNEFSSHIIGNICSKNIIDIN